MIFTESNWRKYLSWTRVIILVLLIYPWSAWRKVENVKEWCHIRLNFPNWYHAWRKLTATRLTNSLSIMNISVFGNNKRTTIRKNIFPRKPQDKSWSRIISLSTYICEAKTRKVLPGMYYAPLCWERHGKEEVYFLAYVIWRKKILMSPDNRRKGQEDHRTHLDFVLAIQLEVV